eukprot:scaffold3319_cov427-Prasinococcus_capsulatus_cf.AAC.28
MTPLALPKRLQWTRVRVWLYGRLAKRVATAGVVTTRTGNRRAAACGESQAAMGRVFASSPLTTGARVQGLSGSPRGSEHARPAGPDPPSRSRGRAGIGLSAVSTTNTPPAPDLARAAPARNPPALSRRRSTLLKD